MIYSDKCQHSIAERGGYICIMCCGTLLRSTLQDGRTHSFSCWQTSCSWVSLFWWLCWARVTLPKVLPLPTSKDWPVQETNVWTWSNLGPFCRKIPASEFVLGLDEALHNPASFTSVQMLTLWAHPVIPCVQISVVEFVS